MMQIIRTQDMRRRHRELHVSIDEILAALAARDGVAAEALMRRHIGDFSGALRTLM
jgi:DNA-binding GntR family transcriptional regulator